MTYRKCLRNYRSVLCLILCLPLLSITACQSTQKPAETKGDSQAAMNTFPQTIEEAVSSPKRSQENRPRDRYRHPVETLTFFGLKPNMTVVEIAPGGGWYLEILAPLLNEKGHYIAAVPPSTDDPSSGMLSDAASEWVKGNPELANRIVRTVFSPPTKIDIAPPESVDMVLTFRNVHNWMAKKAAQRAFDGFFKALKPGGVLGVVEHRANPNAKKDSLAKSGYVLEKDVIAFATKAGFKLADKSEINANAKDTKNYPEGVWTLPPTLRLEDKERDKYLAIGESDRMTLKFVKP